MGCNCLLEEQWQHLSSTWPPGPKELSYLGNIYSSVKGGYRSFEEESKKQAGKALVHKPKIWTGPSVSPEKQTRKPKGLPLYIQRPQESGFKYNPCTHTHTHTQLLHVYLLNQQKLYQKLTTIQFCTKLGKKRLNLLHVTAFNYCYKDWPGAPHQSMQPPTFQKELKPQLEAQSLLNPYTSKELC